MTKTNDLWPNGGWWARVEAKAKAMSVAELDFSIQDCTEAAANADLIQRQGRRVTKSSAEYRDESSVFQAEKLGRKAKDAVEAIPNAKGEDYYEWPNEGWMDEQSDRAETLGDQELMEELTREFAAFREVTAREMKDGPTAIPSKKHLDLFAILEIERVRRDVEREQL